MIIIQIVRHNGEIVKFLMPSWSRAWKLYRRIKDLNCIISIG